MLGTLTARNRPAEGAGHKETFMQRISKNFSLEEFNCKDGTKVPIEYLRNIYALAKNLQVLRDFIGGPIIINSGYRSIIYNAKVGGAKRSMHLYGMAADISHKAVTPKEMKFTIEHLIKEGKMENGGIGLYPSFIHYDIGEIRRW